MLTVLFPWLNVLSSYDDAMSASFQYPVQMKLLPRLTVTTYGNVGSRQN